MDKINKPIQVDGSIHDYIERIDTSLDNPSLLYAEEKGVFPLLHQVAINNYSQPDLTRKNFKDIKNKRSVEFVAECLDYWWNNSELRPKKHLFYDVLDRLKDLLKIRGFGEELKKNVKMEVYYILRYFELSGVYDEDFFDNIWKDAPSEVKANNFLEKNEIQTSY